MTRSNPAYCSGVFLVTCFGVLDFEVFVLEFAPIDGLPTGAGAMGEVTALKG